MDNAYAVMKERHQNEVNNFPLMFAFNKEQFEEGMRSLGLKPTDYDKVYRLGDTGGYYRKTDAPAFHEMLQRHEAEMKQAIAEDKTGDGFIFDMFSYELANHEYGYTQDITDTLDALGMTAEEVEADARLLHGLQKAIAGDSLARCVRNGSDFIEDHEGENRDRSGQKPLGDIVEKATAKRDQQNQVCSISAKERNDQKQR